MCPRNAKKPASWRVFLCARPQRQASAVSLKKRSRPNLNHFSALLRQRPLLPKRYAEERNILRDLLQNNFLEAEFLAQWRCV